MSRQQQQRRAQKEAQRVEVPTVPLSVMSSSALRAEEDLAYLQKTMPLLAIKSVLQYCKSLKASISACRSGSLEHEDNAPGARALLAGHSMH